MTSDAEGNLFIARYGGVMKSDGTPGARLGVVAELSGPLYSLSFGPNGNLFVGHPTAKSVVEVDGITGSVLGTFASAGGLTSPHLLLFGGPQNDLFVGSDSPPRILQYDGRTGAFIRVFASGDGIGYLNPLLMHPNGNLLASTDLGNTILEFDPVTGELVRTFAEGLDFSANYAIVLRSYPVELLLDLVETVDRLELMNGIEVRLTARLNAALGVLQDSDEENDPEARNALNAFINQVNAQRGKKIPEADADGLISAASEIIDLLVTAYSQ